MNPIFSFISRVSSSTFQPVVNVSKHSFPQVVLESPIPVVSQFFATWCGPCQELKPRITKAAEKYNKNNPKSPVRLAMIDIDENQDLAAQYKISVVPTIMWFSNGETKGTHPGRMNDSELDKLFSQLGTESS